MPELDFHIESASAVSDALLPTLALKLRLTNSLSLEQIQTILLHCQLRLEVTRRRYNCREQERLKDLFGDPQQWRRSLRSFLWTHVTLVVPSFTESTKVDLNVPCTFDFNVAATKYFAAQEGGEIPLVALFSGTIFYRAQSGVLQATQLSWENEAAYLLPVSIWKQMMDFYYPNTAWLCLRRDTHDLLHRYKIQNGIPTWEAALENLLPKERNAVRHVDDISRP